VTEVTPCILPVLGASQSEKIITPELVRWGCLPIDTLLAAVRADNVARRLGDKPILKEALMKSARTDCEENLRQKKVHFCRDSWCIPRKYNAFMAKYFPQAVDGAFDQWFLNIPGTQPSFCGGM